MKFQSTSLAKMFSYCLFCLFSFVFVSTINASDDAHTTRVLSLQPAVTETLCQLGREDYLVGISDYCQTTASIPRVGGLYNPNLERIIRCKPDVVFLHPSQTELILQLKELKIKSVAVQTATFSDVMQMIRECMVNVPASPKGKSLYEKMLSLEKLTKTLKFGASSDEAPKVLFVVANDQHSYPVFVATPRSYHGTLLKLAGAANALKDDGELSSIPLSVEQIIRLNPDAIIDISFFDDDKAHACYHSLSTVNAVKYGQVYGMKSYGMETPGFSAIDAVSSISAVLKHKEEEHK